MRLVMSSQTALIGLRTTPPKLEIHQPDIDDSSLKNTLPKVEMQSTQPQIRIDQTEPFAESGLKSVFRMQSEMAANARSQMLKDMGTNISQGNELADIQNKGNPIAEQADYNAFGRNNFSFGMVTMPKSKPKIDVIEGRVDIQVKEGELQGKYKVQQPRINGVPGSLEIYLRQRNKLDIKVERDKFDRYG